MQTSQLIRELSIKYQQILQNGREIEQLQVNDYRLRLQSLVERFGKVKPGPELPQTIPAIFNRSYDENFISDYLAYIINPRSNGIGTAPLLKLIQLFDIDAESLPLEEVSVFREYTLDRGRIDLLLEMEDTFILGIEVKLYSPEGEGQTKYYAKEITEQFRDMPSLLIFLTIGGKRPGSKIFQPLSFKELLETFRNIPLKEIPNNRKRVLWQDFLEHLEVYIIMSKPDQFVFSEKTKLYIEYYDMLQDLEKSFKDDWGKTIQFLEYKLNETLDDATWRTHFNPGLSTTWYQVLKPSWDFPDLYIHYEYFFSRSRLHNGKIAFMLEMERDRANEILVLFDERFPTLEAEFQSKKIAYRPSFRKHAIAWKEYPIQQDLESISRVFISAFEEFRFLEPEIDALIADISITHP